ncbi:MAG: hypothetical protein ACTSP4_09985 [Candidatus Hodarchaeales archaeon]
MVLELQAEKLAFILRGKNRCEIYRVLLDGSSTMNDMSLKTRIMVSNISRIIKELESHGIVENETPSKRSGCLYRLTPEARAFEREIKKHLELHQSA